MKAFKITKDESSKRIYELSIGRINNIISLSEKINTYIAYSCSFILIYFITHIDFFKRYINKSTLFIFTLIPLLTIILAILQLYLNFKGEIANLNLLGAKHDFLINEEEIKFEKQIQSIKRYNSVQIWIEYLTVMLCFILSIEIIYIFYKIIFI